MNDWSNGYVTDIGYTFGYYPELNPLRTRMAFLSAGLGPPRFERCCELGFGQGLSINIHAASSQAHWFGTDFNPDQALFARDLAQGSRAKLSVYDDSFEEFLTRKDLPEFDFIGLHGIWSWVSEQNRRHLVNFVQKKLAVGGVFYVSYNTLPGWSPMVSLRHMMSQHAANISSRSKSILGNVSDAISFCERLISQSPAYSSSFPTMKDRIKRLSSQNKSYLAHEYFNRDWCPMHFSEISELLQEAKLSFVCSANYLDHIESINLTKEQLALINEIENTTFRQLVRDFMVNQQFRRDYWVRGGQRQSRPEQINEIKKTRIVLTTPAKNVSYKVQGSLGSGDLQKGVYEPLLELLSDHKVYSIGEVSEKVSKSGGGQAVAQTFHACMVLLGKGDLSIAQDEESHHGSRESALRFNSSILSKSELSFDLNYLASPVISGGVNISRFYQLFLRSRNSGKKTPDLWAQDAWGILDRQNQRVVKEGRPLESPEENIKELQKQARDFNQSYLPIIKALDMA